MTFTPADMYLRGWRDAYDRARGTNADLSLSASVAYRIMLDALKQGFEQAESQAVAAKIKEEAFMPITTPKPDPEVFHGFKIEIGPHKTSLETTKDMSKFVIRARILQSVDALLGITEQDLI